MPPIHGRRATAMKLRPANIQRKAAADTARILANANNKPRGYDFTPELLEALGEVYITQGWRGLDAYTTRNRIDIPLTTIMARLRYYGYRRQGRRMPRPAGANLERIQHLQRLLSSNTTIADCARLLNVDVQAIYRVIRKYGLQRPEGHSDSASRLSYQASYSTIRVTHPLLILSDLHYPYTNWHFITKVANLCAEWGGTDVLLLGEVIHDYNTTNRRKGEKDPQTAEEINAALDDIAETLNILGFDIIHRFAGRVETTQRTLDHKAYGIRVINGKSVWSTRNLPMQGHFANRGIQSTVQRFGTNILIGYAHSPRTYYDPHSPYTVIQLGSATAEHRLPERCRHLSKLPQRNLNGAVIMVPEGNRIIPITIDETTPVERMYSMYSKGDFHDR